ncbi:Abi family protein [Trueperella pyogenes]|uniref:Abi family protein n=1 Tax=Trueperella pyogenes TaxID=1661 RepID=UPI003873B19A
MLDFADISRVSMGIPPSEQRVVAEGFGAVIDLTPFTKNQQCKAKLQSSLVRWMEQLTIVRNFCAHYSRLWRLLREWVVTAGLSWAYS